MANVSVDNESVIVALNPKESFTLKSGLRIVANVQAGDEARASISDGTKTAQEIVGGVNTDLSSEISVVLTDETTVSEDASGHVFISGFVV